MRLFEFTQPLMEAPARIQHAEDLIFWEGSAGAVRALKSIYNMTKAGHKDVTVKWDGSPAIIFGRDETGEFILTDKSGFGAKGYNGKAKSGKELSDLMLARVKNGKPDASRKAFAKRMEQIFDIYERAVPKDFRGFFKGDLLYFKRPVKRGGKFEFTPNAVTYTVEADCEVGKKIAQSTTAVVIHRIVDEAGNEHPLTDYDIFEGTEAFVMPPVTLSHAVEMDLSPIKSLKAVVNKNAKAIDDLLNVQELTEMKMKDFPNTLYAYVNSKVDDPSDSLGNDYAQFVSNHPKISDKKKEKMAQYIQTHAQGLAALWETVRGIQQVKDKIISDLDTRPMDVMATIGSAQGGEGYVMAQPDGDIKLVNRSGFSAANRALER